MRNPFIAIAASMAMLRAEMQMASVMAFNFGYAESSVGSSRQHSSRTVAQDKRDATKARNRKRSKR